MLRPRLDAKTLPRFSQPMLRVPKLKYRADRRTLGFVATFFALVALGFVLHDGAWWLRIPLFVATCLFAFFCAVITHNTVHQPMFVDRQHNKLMQVALSLTYGAPVSVFVPGHNNSHHRFTQTAKDQMRTTKARFRWNLLNQLFFAPIVAIPILRSERTFLRIFKREKPRWYRQLCVERTALHGYRLATLFLAIYIGSPEAFFLAVLGPQVYAMWGIIGINYIQHDGCDHRHPYNHSRNFVGWWVNWWTFNNGYHGMHHMKPSLHWSLLPQAHAKELGPHIHPALEEPSLFLYIWRTFVWPGRRVDYLGNPISLPDSDPDESWVFDRNGARSSIELQVP